ncbi:MAG TPA: APC family permease, partial [Acidobacteriota bacterium]|nr:APC family permease [Acidobacteriota bacterium]
MNQEDPSLHSVEAENGIPQTTWMRVRRAVLGAPRNLYDPALRHRVSLIAFLAWVGLGADGLSSSSYGPDAAFRMLGDKTYLAVGLALATAATVFIISYAYSRIIEHFPLGGGGYMVASALLGKYAGVTSGCALLVDYVLTVATSIASCGDAVFSLLPLPWHTFKFPMEMAAIILLTILNIRGVKESVSILVPIFLTFLISHAILILGGLLMHVDSAPAVAAAATAQFHHDVSAIGMWALFLIFLRAYSLGGGTYTGIEAVSNGLGIMREPRVETGKKTMRYMAISLALTAAGLIVCFMLAGVRPIEGQTLNAVLATELMGRFHLHGLPVGAWSVAITIFSEAILLIVAAQAGFIDGPRVMANMATDAWLPKRLSSISDRLTSQYGIMLVGAAAAATLVYTRGRIETLLVMYSLNVFLTFSLSNSGMVRFWVRSRKDQPAWKKNLMIHGLGLVLCFAIFCVMLYEKFSEGAWLTLLITLTLVAGCIIIKKHYIHAGNIIRQVDRDLMNTPAPPEAEVPAPLIFDPKQPTAGVLVSEFNGLGLHVFFSIFRLFPNVYKNVVFISVGLINSEFFREESSVTNYEEKTKNMLGKYVDFARQLRIPARSAYRVGTEIVHEASELCLSLSREYPRIVFFAGESVFERPQWYHRLLHNETGYSIQQKIRFAGLPMVILPIVIR